MIDLRPQLDKFKDLARELECDEDEAAFDERLKVLAKAPAPKAGFWRVDFATPHGHRANFYPDDPAVTWASSPVFSTPQEVYRWLQAQNCVQVEGDTDRWLDR